ncbi:HIT family protein [Brevibacillus brevis X23]|nr:HIT family protein [Brevibacillus brevis X23]
MNCLGCRLANSLEPVNIVYEDNNICCILDIEPFNEGHTLILPKKHFFELEELDDETALAIIIASKKLSIVLKRLYGLDGISVSQNGGLFNELTHYHMHLIPRFQGDGFSWSEPLFKHGAEDRLAVTKYKMIEALKNL